MWTCEVFNGKNGDVVAKAKWRGHIYLQVLFRELQHFPAVFDQTGMGVCPWLAASSTALIPQLEFIERNKSRCDYNA